jgi:hypothetical protein
MVWKVDRTQVSFQVISRRKQIISRFCYLEREEKKRQRLLECTTLEYNSHSAQQIIQVQVPVQSLIVSNKHSNFKNVGHRITHRER